MSRSRLEFGIALLIVGLLMMNFESLRALMQALSSKRDIAAAQSWCDQLSEVDATVLNQISCDVLVIDADDALAAHPAKTLQQFRVGPSGHRRNLFAYLSVGAAEAYRNYWEHQWILDPPRWIVGPNQEWPGNFRVRFWRRDWQAIVYNGLNAVLNAGFDGVFLDNVDAYQELSSENSNARAQMIAFVTELAREAITKRPEFKIIVQNAEELLAWPEYLQAIHGIVKESLLFGIQGEDVRNPAEAIDYSTQLLGIARRQGKPVFVVEYISEDLVESARNEIRQYGFVPFFAERLLDRPLRARANRRAEPP